MTEIRPVAYQPGTLLFESDLFSLQNKYNTVTIHGIGVDLPQDTSEVTWSVEFLNLGVGRAGLLLYDPPTVGDSHDDFWEKVNGEWELKSTEDGSNFAARLAGVPLGKEDQKVIYENAKTSLGKVYLTSKEVGDTVILDGDNSELTAIQFEYYAALSPFGDIPKGKVRLYLNDGESHGSAEVAVNPRGELTLPPDGSVVYDNPRGVKGDIQIAASEIGDTFALDGSRRMINQIQFEYYAALNPFESGQKGVLRFFANNVDTTGEGGAKKPGDLLFESDRFSLRAGYNMVTVSDLRVLVPEEVTSVTWAFDFSGLTGIGKVGLLRHDEPAKGESANSYWLNIGTSAKPEWQLQSPADGRGNFSARIVAQIPPPVSLAISSEVYKFGSTIEVTYSNGPGNSKDWIGIYRPDAIPGSAAASAWAYVNGSKTPGKGSSDGMVVFNDALASGNYVARLFEDDGYMQLASATFTIAEPPGLSMGSETHLPAQPITVHFANGPGNPKDWIAVYRPDMVPAKTPSLLWAFVNGTQIAGDGLTDGSVTFTTGLPPGEYVARFLENDGYTQLVEVSFSVTDNTAPVIRLIGSSNITIPVGGDYTDAGATAIDDVDGAVTSSLQATGEVNVNKPGIYTITFNVKDKSGNAAAAVIRTITVADVVPPVITLIGSSNIAIPVGGDYTDAGATAYDNSDGDISSLIRVSGVILTGKPGIYTMTFNVKDKSGNAAKKVIRTITVEDQTSPVITLNGFKAVTVQFGDVYKDAGATARDNVDGNVTSSIQTTGADNVNQPGVHTITFNVKDKSGNIAVPVVRTVTVLDDVPPVITLNGSLSVTIHVGDRYTDAGATAWDNADGDISSLIEVSGIIPTGSPGVFTRTYKVRDKSGNAAEPLVRIIRVIEPGPPALQIARNADGTFTIRFEGQLQTAPGVNASWRTISLESPAVLPADQAAAFFRAKR
ncbi:MAG: DUF5011 domain-containing protein [Verrucomicrobiota bacterium]|nr:DUF5011 domain-containing protein [Verrucomicrobiota bacterium]